MKKKKQNVSFCKKWEDLTIRDNFMFLFVMQNKDIAKEFLEKLLSIKIKNVFILEIENTFKLP